MTELEARLSKSLESVGYIDSGSEERQAKGQEQVLIQSLEEQIETARAATEGRQKQIEGLTQELQDAKSHSSSLSESVQALTGDL